MIGVHAEFVGEVLSSDLSEEYSECCETVSSASDGLLRASHTLCLSHCASLALCLSHVVPLPTLCLSHCASLALCLSHCASPTT